MDAAVGSALAEPVEPACDARSAGSAVDRLGADSQRLLPVRLVDEQLLDWAASFGAKRFVFAIEGTGSYGAGLTSAVRRRDIGVIEVLRTDRRDRRPRGKSDTIDAENAARAVLNGDATAVPKTNGGVVEMLRQIKVAKDVAVKARTATMITLKALIVTARPELREQLQPLSKMALIQRCASLRPGDIDTVTAATKHALRSLARRWQYLNDEIRTHGALLAQLTAQHVPQLVAAFGVGADTAAEMLIVAGDNIDRVRSEPAWARLCGVAPVPASSGLTNRHRLNRGGHRQANAALARAVIVRMQHHQPTAPTSPAAPPKARPKPRSSAASNDSSPVKSGPCYDPSATPHPQFDTYRSVNALMETFWSTLKIELVYRMSRRTRDEAENAIFEYIDGWYNTRRIQRELGYQSPDEYETAWHAQNEPDNLTPVPTGGR
ncbi:hypothetical protein GCM10020218_008390 [Dactylosporangium vinaceum]|uniref:Transposase n=1 Tax=Dactylosporangium vinaceum TaxID=53362 RepID=A0ABV5MK64_9ACTN